ncbi:TetR/AcrR family transcriptional regulator [Mycobacteroides salmoniphilum]|uniref:TetR/AcrR family transcriptional regulator n=1 Tax=Mycobacteroides salmoniphilum TaxID=404941 RepID=UPI000993095B|nr:TetR/AcrR family transcriptional regulator [Mycobacteroides salmoniphilum]QCH23965.1 Fatty acid metabolism regulator protein [Mycobacteroides salmoniphilum]
MTATRGYGGIPAEQRRAERRARLLDASLEIVGSQGYNSLSVSGLCQATGLNDRYFYEHFENRHAIFVALVDELAAQTLAAMTAAIAASGSNGRQIVRAGLGACIDLLTGDPRKARVVFVESPAHNSHQHRTQIRGMFIALMRAQADRMASEALSRDREHRVTLAGVQLFGALMESVTSWLAGDLAIGKEQLIDLSADLLLTVTNHVLAVDNIPSA